MTGVSRPQCDTCWKFIRLEAPASWASIFDRVGMCLDHEAYRCGECSERLGVSNALQGKPPQRVFFNGVEADLAEGIGATIADDDKPATIHPR